MPVVPIVLLAAALHATWNALVKSVHERLGLMAVMGGATAAIMLPIALLAVAPRSRAWPEVGASICLHTVYNLLLVATYRDGDYNQVYPIARGTAPPVVAIASLILIGEQLSAVQCLGLVALSGGLLTLAVARRQGSPRAVLLAVLTGLLIAAYTVVDGIGVRHSGSVLGYASWLFVGNGLLTLLAPLAIRRAHGGSQAALRGSVLARGSAAGALSISAYVLVLWAQTRGALAVVAALRETSVVFAAALGATVFHERLPSRRLIASALVAVGAAALALG